jgi:hypothetical protein
VTAELARAELKNVFNSTWENQFTFRPDVDRFFSKMKSGSGSKPMLLIC